MTPARLRKFFWYGYFVYCTSSTGNALSFFAGSFALQALWWNVHARAADECRCLSIGLAVLASPQRNSLLVLGVCMASLHPFLMPNTVTGLQQDDIDAMLAAHRTAIDEAHLAAMSEEEFWDSDDGCDDIAELLDEAPSSVPTAHISGKNLCVDMASLEQAHENLRQQVQAAGGVATLRTCGDGACSVHAVLGTPNDFRELYHADARDWIATWPHSIICLALFICFSCEYCILICAL